MLLPEKTIFESRDVKITESRLHLWIINKEEKGMICFRFQTGIARKIKEDILEGAISPKGVWLAYKDIAEYYS